MNISDKDYVTRTFNSSFDDIPANFLSLIPPEATLGPLINIEDSNPPTVLIGQLVTSANCGLVIQDKTCSVQCMFKDLNISDVGSLVLIYGYSYIRNPIHSYVEVSEYQSISDHTSKLYCSENSVQHGKRLTGIVTAVSTPLRLGGSFYIFIELHTSEGKNDVIITATHLLYLYCYLTIGNCYVFTEMKDSVMNKGKNNQHRVIVTTQHSTISEMKDDSLMIVPSLRESSTLVSYQGVITDVVIPEIGVYELDNTVRLYLCCLSNINNGVGFRPGNEILISNAHFIKFPSHKLKHLSGFVCCVYSSIKFIKLSKNDDNNEYKPFISQGNRLRKFIVKYSICDIVLLLEVYRYCKHRLHICNLDCLLLLLNTVAAFTGLTTSVPDDPVALFFIVPHHCSCNDINDSLLSDQTYMMFPTMTEFAQAITSSNSYPPSLSGYSTSNSDEESLVQFTYSQSVINQVLIIGRLSSNNVGGVTLVDYTRQTKLTVLLSSDILPHIGDHLVITSVKVVQEYTYTLSSTTNLSTIHYIIPLQWTPLSASITSLSSPTVCMCLYFVVVTKNKPIACNATTVTADIHIRISTDPNTLLHDHQSSLHTETILKLNHDFTRYYSLLRPGCLYSLVSYNDDDTPLLMVSLPLLTLSHNRIIEFLEEEKKWEIVPSMDVQELLTKYTKSAKDNQSEMVVTVSGIITDRSYRIRDPSSIMSSASSLDQFIVALYLKSIVSPDTVVVYIQKPEYFPPPIGLVPGAEVKFVQVTLKYSKSNNLYCTYSLISSVEILRFPVLLSINTAPLQCDLPITHLSDLMQSYATQTLSSASVCLMGRIIVVQYLEMRAECAVHLTGGTCSKYCNQQRSVKVEGSAQFCDGSGECTLYFDTDCSQRLLKCSNLKWTKLIEATKELGLLKYYKIQEQAQNEAEAMLQSVARSSNVTSELRLLCKPFSNRYTNNHDNERSPRTRKLKVGNQVYTVEIPNERLQLSVVSILKIDYAKLAQEFYCSLQSS